MAHILRQLAEMLAAFAVTVRVTSGERGAVNISKVAEAGFFEVMSMLWIVALVFLAIVPSSFKTVFVGLCSRCLRHFSGRLVTKIATKRHKKPIRSLPHGTATYLSHHSRKPT